MAFKTFFVCCILLIEVVLSKRDLVSSMKAFAQRRELVVGGVDADADRFDYFVTVSVEENISPDDTFHLTSGVLITSNVILFGTQFLEGVIAANQSHLLNVTIGNRAENQETRRIVDLREVGETGANLSFAVAVLDSPSSKTPPSLDDGSCPTDKGCLDVSILGRGLTFFQAPPSGPGGGFPITPTLNQVLQKADTQLLSPDICETGFDLENAYYDANIKFFEAYYNCPDLECLGPGKNVFLQELRFYSYYYSSDYEALFEPAFDLFRNGSATCLRSPGQDLCWGDSGAPVLAKNQDILVGLFPTNRDCAFDGESSILPVSVVFTSSFRKDIQDAILSLPNADANVATADAGLCACATDEDENANLKLILPLVAAAFILIPGSIFAYRKYKYTDTVVLFDEGMSSRQTTFQSQ
eukprot:CAMPEP_0184068558 /NCGR_PEP_ID=MMETSP0957-20130417/34406_1 /TAXON_ID=627963 /ORGANISM="Aplanochytrium sp, Strain PBS07" /LENGTH=412 /DNA_ID=CAMNT_0026367535 /DNA_START=77 /DNA_END=1315 /DNA_ORIENTATION=+